MISVYVSYPDKKTAIAISNQLLDDKLIACSNLSKHLSIYNWDDKKVVEKEWATFFKSKSEHWDEIVKRISELHPYDVPCIIKYNIESNQSYEDWVNQACK